MKLTRRQFGQGILATGAMVALPIPAFAAKYHEVEKSFFADQSWPLDYIDNRGIHIPSASTMQLNVLRVRYNTQSSKNSWPLSPGEEDITKRLNIAIKIEVIGPDHLPQFEVESLGHAEYKFLHATHPSRDIYDHLVHGPDIKYEYGYRLINMIIRGCNRIGFITRRGSGNQIIYHPSNRLLVSETTAPIKSWTHVKYWETKNCPQDKIVCLYKGQGEIDSGYIYADTRQRKYLWEMQKQEPYLGNAHDYVQEISLQNI